MPQPEEKPQGQKQRPLPLSFISASCLFLLQLITPPLPLVSGLLIANFMHSLW